MEDLRHIFENTASKYTDDKTLIQTLWKEIEESYSQKNQFYHNLSHIKSIFHYLEPVKPDISDWDTIIFSSFYHDIIYNIHSSKNEENSAELAGKRLKEISYPDELIKKSINQILATKEHKTTTDSDTDLFTDADLAILGQDQNIYKEYCSLIRKEYAIFPDFIYNKGRIKVLNHFLEMERIYKSAYFYQTLEEKARQNITMELESLKQ